MRHLVPVALLSAVLVTTVTPAAVLGAAKPDDIHDVILLRHVIPNETPSSINAKYVAA
jgi:hypothetical protein